MGGSRSGGISSESVLMKLKIVNNSVLLEIHYVAK